MAGEDKKDHQPWTPRLESTPLFLNSADLERRLGQADEPLAPQLDVADKDPVAEPAGVGTGAAPAGNSPVLKPAV